MSKFYMVYAEGGNTPAVKHEDYITASNEANRLSKKLGVKCYVMETMVEVEGFIEVKKHKPKRPCWFQWKKEESAARTNALLEKLREEEGVPDLPEFEPIDYCDGDIVYCYNNEIHTASPNLQLGRMIQMFGTELRVKEE